MKANKKKQTESVDNLGFYKMEVGDDGYLHKTYDSCGEFELYRKSSTVQDVFERVDVGGVVGAYLLTAYKPEGADMHPIQERIQGLDNLIVTIRKNIDLFRMCTPAKNEESRTVFITEEELSGWNERGQTNWDCFTVMDKEAREILAEPQVEKLPDRWVMCDRTIEELAGMRLAWPSEDKYGAEACCAVILRELFAFGYTAEKRKKYFDWLEKEMANYDQEGDPVEHEGFYDPELEECESEDEREHLRFWREYRSKVFKIEKRYEKPIKEHNALQFEKMLRQEYVHYFFKN